MAKPMTPRNQTAQQPQGNTGSTDTTEQATGTDTSSGNEETETPATEQTDTAVIEQPTPEPVEAGDTAVAPTEEAPAQLCDEDNGLVGRLSEQLNAFTVAIDQPGRDPEDFSEAARIVQQITRFVIRTPRQPVLDRLLAFFTDNAEGVASERVYLKGVSTLSNPDQQQITHLHTMFTDLAAGRATKVNSSQILAVLKKPEILNYYNRKMAVIRQGA